MLFQSKHVRPFRKYIHPSIHLSFHPCMHACMHPSIQWPKWVRNDQKGYEMTWVRIDHHIVISYPVELGTKWPKWVRNDLGTKWLLLGMKWPKRRYEMTKVGTKWPTYEMTGNHGVEWEGGGGLWNILPTGKEGFENILNSGKAGSWNYFAI